MSTSIRTRFAPSPTGYLHVGGIRTALFAYLVARQADGQFILRLEDTDQKREVEGSADHLIECLQTLGITYDEGPDKPGKFGPYKQSERLDIYKAWAQKLIDAGRAYADPYTPDEVQTFREQAQKEKKPFLYRNNRPENPPAWDGSTPLRFKSDPKAYEWHDEVMGDLKTGPEVIDDIILIKSDGFPTYNFAHIVDDAEMQITHVIRGQEFLASTPNYLNLYEALGLERPTYATMPHILNEQGNKKLGKRDGAKDVLDYVREGFLPDALVSFIATLGWNDGTEQEIFTRQELIEKFSLDRVGRSGAHFDQRRLLWTNGHFIREMPLDNLYHLTCHSERSDNEAEESQQILRQTQDDSTGFWPAAAADADEAYQKQVLSLVQERMKYLAELPELTSFFFEEPVPNPELISTNKQLKKLDRAELQDILKLSADELAQTDFTPEAIQNCLNALLQTTNHKPSTLFSLIRIATTWAPASPELAPSLAVLGRDRALTRIQTTIDTL
jgi:glutamyl-tRNA synthetase